MLARLPGVEIAALAEPDEGRRADALRIAPGASALADYAEVLDLPEVDAVVVCLPNALHAEAAAAALGAGKHVYLEKPLATDLDDARRVLEAWRASGRVAALGFNYRANGLVEAARAHIRAGRVGEVVGASTVFTAASRELPEWKRRRATGGGALLDKASHHVDLVLHLIGRPVREASAALESRVTEDDNATVQLRLEGGALVQSFFSLTAVDEDRFEVHGAGGRVAVDRLRGLDVELTPAGAPVSLLRDAGRVVRAAVRGPYGIRRLFHPDLEPSYAAALARFATAARQGRWVRPDLWDGFRSLAVIAAAEESARTSRTVRVPELDGV